MKEYAIPDKNNPHNYMLDTCACSHIFNCQDSINIIKKSLELGFQYYTTAIQDLEFDGEGSRTYDKNCISSNSRTRQELPQTVIDRLNTMEQTLQAKYVPEMATALRDHSRLDGTVIFGDSKSLAFKLYQTIIEKNDPNSPNPFKNSHDALIAHSAMIHNCILVTDDQMIYRETNNLFPNRAITSKDLLNIINNL